MNKPINVEAQRIQKIMSETRQKLVVLQLLSEEFFQDLKKKEVSDIKNLFGSNVTKLLLKHADLEEQFKTTCMDDGIKMTQLDGDISDEARKIILTLKKTTSQLVRIFMEKPMQDKLRKLGEPKPNDLTLFIENFDDLNKYIDFKMTTPLEEQKSVKEARMYLENKTQRLETQYTQKKESYDKYQQECSKSKEMRESEIQALRNKIGTEQHEMEQSLKQLDEEGGKKKTDMDEKHKDEVARLNKEIQKLTTTLGELKKNNKNEETKSREQMKKADLAYHDNINTYDTEMSDNMKELQNAENTYVQIHNELKQFREDYEQRLEERRKREEIQAMRKKKSDEQEAQRNLLNQGAEWMQAHWRGMLARIDMAKAKKAIKKKKKGKK